MHYLCVAFLSMPSPPLPSSAAAAQIPDVVSMLHCNRTFVKTLRVVGGHQQPIAKLFFRRVPRHLQQVEARRCRRKAVRPARPPAVQDKTSAGCHCSPSSWQSLWLGLKETRCRNRALLLARLHPCLELETRTIPPLANRVQARLCTLQMLANRRRQSQGHRKAAV